MTQPDTYSIHLTGPWAGFGFQRHKLYTPEGHEFEPYELTWLSLLCNITREWRQLMDEEARARDLERPSAIEQLDRTMPARSSCDRSTSVIYLRDVLRRRREERYAGVDGAGFAGNTSAGRATRRPRRPRRG